MASSSSQIPSSSVTYSVSSLSTQISSSSAETSRQLPWDVFLSFHGRDTRSTFVSHLYAALDGNGIRTFMDKPELHAGEVISDTLIKAIKESKTYIVVFSENYASSSWCLDELVEIYNCCQTMERLVIGVYYHISPSVVRHQTGSFKKAFEKHDSRFKGDIQKWCHALEGVAGISGQTISASDERDEAKIVDEIVEEILLLIKPKTLFVTKYPVGLNSRVDDIAFRLSSGTKGVTKFGIYGMGGVGKTTLARALYNRLLVRKFKGSCFLAEVSKASGETNGLVSLQKQLLNSVLKSKTKLEVPNVEEGTMMIRDRTCSAKVLLVMDDIDHFKQYESLVGPFASGSIVIITTRDEDILNKIGVVLRYSVSGLSNADSLELFTRHAFGDAKPNNTFLKLSEDVLRHAGGLPLALEVFGSTLLNVSEERWRCFINSLKQFPNAEVGEILVLSFDALKPVNPQLQDIFLDIACFFIGWKKEVVVKIMETCYKYANNWIEVLKQKCLLTINDDDELDMHALLQDMGRGIVHKNSHDEPEKHSRLWVSEDIFKVLNKEKGTKAIEGIIPRAFYSKDALDGASFATKTFRRMVKLRFLYLKNVNLKGSFEQTFESLRWLHWDCCLLKYLPSDFYPEELVILELPRSKLRTIWDLNMDKQVFEKLKTLDLSNSLDLIRTPDFTKLPCLEYLNFEGCECLAEVHISIGCLVGLISLNLGGCVKVRSLPDSVCNLRALNSLNIGGCSALIGSLTEVNVWGLTVWKLPISIGHLSKLVELNPRYDNSIFETSSSGALYRTPHWDVFLCFRGIDTKFTFANHLYEALDREGVSTYIDNPEVRSTEAVSHVLPRAIQESRTCLVVFSEDFASSDRCLDELIEILSCKKTLKRLVIPVFYNIDRSDVRCQTGMFKEAFERHQIFFDAETVNKWRLTLTEVADFPGHSISDNRSEAEIIEVIIDDILLKISPLYTAQYPVGLDSGIKDVTTLLRSGTEGVTKIGMYGMGGVGKTTLAKAVYNRNCRWFQGSCFLANVREVSRTEKGLVHLQQQLINDVLKCKNIIIDDVDQGIELIRARICLTRVLIVIDDLDNPLPLKFLEGPFGLGSMILITTRDEDLLDSIQVETKYKVNTLGDALSLQLFINHAFGDNKISRTYLELSEKILEPAGGLPLALKVLGSHLRNQSEERWRWYIDKLVRFSSFDYNIETRLLVSFDELKAVDPMLQSIFLDIACFFIGHKKEEVVKIMETYYSDIDHKIDILKKRCLLTLGNRDELGMHDLLLNMGRKVARNNSADEPGKHSRLWESKDIFNVLKNHKGTEAIQGIMPSNLCYQNLLEGASFAAETFKRMSEIRFLYLENVNLTGSFEHTFKVLKFLCWKCCPLKCLPSEFYPEELVVLELTHSKLRIMWETKMVSRVFKKLKTLNMSHSKDLTTTPDFSELPYLETLNLECCKSLEEVDITIGSLLWLKSLNLHGCVKLRSLPNTICNLRYLEILDISECEKLEILPNQLWKLTRLRKLNAGGATLLKELPDIELLQKLYLSESAITALPSGISQLRNLEDLVLTDCRHLLSVTELPPNLKWICAKSCTSVERIQNLSNLKQLEILELTDCSSLTSVIGLEELSALKILHLTGCSSTLLAYIFTKRFFQIYCEFGHPIHIYAPSAEFPHWISQSSEYGSTISMNLRPNESQDFLGIVICFKHLDNTCYSTNYTVKNTTSKSVWSFSIEGDGNKSLMVIVPRSIFSVRDGDNRIELTSDDEIMHGIHILYKTEITMIDEYNSTTINVEDEKSYPSKRSKH